MTEYIVLFKNKKLKDKLIKLRDTRGTISFALRISFPNNDYKPRNSSGRAQKQAKSLKSKPRNRKEYIKQWKHEHPDKLRKYGQAWRDKNRDRYNKKMREYMRGRPRKKKSVNSSTKKERKTPNSRRKMVSK